jgi:predicted AlkP superfamily pyrophosphatase or phosphodiesterase
MKGRLLTAAFLLLVQATGCTHQAVKLVVASDSRELRKRAEGEPASSPGKPPIFFLAFDGMNRDLLYDMLRQGQLPALAALLGGAGEGKGAFPHAHFDESFLSTLPSTTMVAWTTALTGVGPAEHGVTGNEFFVREDRALACPAPVSFSDADPTLELYNENYLDKLSAAPSVYDRMRETDPEVLVWVGMHPFHRGADRLLLAKKTVMAAAFEGFIEVQAKNHLESKHSRKLYEVLDKAAVDEVIKSLDGEVLPDVLTLYLSGTDLYAHVAEEGPDEARRTYLKEVLEPQFVRLGDKLSSRHALDGRWVVISADHGHTQIAYDHVHSLANKDKDIPKLLIQSGFRVRPFKRYVDDKDGFNAVVAYGGATSYLYFADRSGCAGDKDVCDWKQPPRYQEDVLAAAEALHRNNEDGSIVPELKGTLDLILTRPPRPFGATE